MKLSTRVMSMVLAVILAMTCLSVCVFAQDGIKSGIGFVTASALRLRSGPSTDVDTLAIAYNGEAVVVLEKNGDWYKVIYNLQEGYMHADYLSVLETENAELGFGRVNADYVNLRTGPDTSYSSINMVSSGDMAYIIGLNRGWYKVIYGDDLCYIRSDFLDLTEYPYENDDSDRTPLFFRGGFSIGVSPSASILKESGYTPAGNGSSSDSDNDYDSDSGSDDEDSYEREEVITTLGQAIAAKALEYKGYPYVWGGESPSSGFDCSGFTYYIAKCFGYYVPHGSESQYSYGEYVAKEDLLPGDFVFFENTYTYGISHCGIYIGDGEFIHAGSSDTGVKINSLSENYYVEHYYGARRLY